MKTIKKDSYTEIEINKSKFITLLYKVHNLSEIKEKIELVKNLYKDATHYCYAYIIDDNKKSSDDGEPGGTAGVPIMEVLLKNDLNYILCVVVRYFGGIKLGAGGLVRAYSKSVSSALIDNSVIDLVDGFLVKLVVSYDEQRKLDYLLKGFEFNKDFDLNVTYLIKLPQDKINFLENYTYDIINIIKIEKDAF